MIVTILQSPVDIQPLPYPNSPSPWVPPTPSSLNEMHNVCIVLDLLDLHRPGIAGLLAFNSHDEAEHTIKLLLYNCVGFAHNAM